MKTSEKQEFMLDDIFRKYPEKSRANLIPILQDVQSHYGYIPENAVLQICEFLNMPASKIYGIATFYNQFKLKPPGRHLIQVCRGTACHVKGSAKLLEFLQRELKVKPDETTKDGRFTLEVVACMGACSIAPVINIDGKYFGRISVSEVPAILEKYE